MSKEKNIIKDHLYEEVSKIYVDDVEDEEFLNELVVAGKEYLSKLDEEDKY